MQNYRSNAMPYNNYRHSQPSCMSKPHTDDCCMNAPRTDDTCMAKRDAYGNKPLAMAYVPWQKNFKMYENLDEAFKTGTIFPELNKPFLGRRIKG